MSTKEDDEFIVVMHLGLALGAIAAAAGAIAAATWTASLNWLLEHHVVVPAAADPWIELPHAAGVGLDGARIAVAASIVLVVLAALVQSVRRWWAKGRELQ